MKERLRSQKQLYAINYVISIFGTLLVATALIFLLITSNRSITTREQERLRVITSSAEGKTRSLLGQLYVTMEILDEWIQSNPSSDPRANPEFNRIIDVFRNFTENTMEIRAIGGDGKLFAFPTTNAQPLLDISDLDYYQGQKYAPEKNLLFAPPIKSWMTGEWGIPVSYKLRNNRFGILALVAIIDYKAIDKAFADLVTSPDEAIRILRNDRLTLYRDPFSELAVGKTIDIDVNIKKEGYAVIDISTPEKDRRSAFFSQLDNYPLYIMVSNDYRKLRAEWIRLALIEILSATVILAGFLYLNALLVSLIHKTETMQKKLEIAAHYDELTGMKNRRYFFERVGEEMERARRTGESMTFLIADIDHFKLVNDTWGHPTGDSVLEKIAGGIESSIRHMDISGRIGGEEFAVLFPETPISSAVEIAERIRESAEKIGHDSWKGGLSIGVAAWRGTNESIDELVKRADDALYKAKETGRNRVVADGEKPE